MRGSWRFLARQLALRRSAAVPVVRRRPRDLPLVSCILVTRDRPRLLRIALACYRHQSYPRRELVVVDDGDRFPADRDAVAAAGGRLVVVEPGTPIGAKLNHGVAAARGQLCQKMDDDDWYSPRYLQTMVAALDAARTEVCRPGVAFVAPFLFFDVASWQLRRSADHNAPGATLLFAREDWEERPFRALSQDEDVWFYADQRRAGAQPVPVRAPDIFLAVRHHGGGSDRGHTWTLQGDGQVLEAWFRNRPLHRRQPESLLPAWALREYLDLRRDLLAARAVQTGGPQRDEPDR